HSGRHAVFLSPWSIIKKRLTGLAFTIIMVSFDLIIPFKTPPTHYPSDNFQQATRTGRGH
ncbi:MAG: hypothetical protein LBD37_00330, partial [Treponema sp.]|nr:hypothetical protein [Treponema sp.]